jgi:hypothetical protein
LAFICNAQVAQAFSHIGFSEQLLKHCSAIFSETSHKFPGSRPFRRPNTGIFHEGFASTIVSSLAHRCINVMI